MGGTDCTWVRGERVQERVLVQDIHQCILVLDLDVAERLQDLQRAGVLDVAEGFHTHRGSEPVEAMAAMAQERLGTRPPWPESCLDCHCPTSIHNTNQSKH